MAYFVNLSSVVSGRNAALLGLPSKP